MRGGLIYSWPPLQRNKPPAFVKALSGGTTGGLWLKLHTSQVRPESESSVLDVPGTTCFISTEMSSCIRATTSLRQCWHITYSYQLRPPERNWDIMPTSHICSYLLPQGVNSSVCTSTFPLNAPDCAAAQIVCVHVCVLLHHCSLIFFFF